MSEHYSNFTAVAKNFSDSDLGCENLLVAYSKACVVPVFTYFKNKLNDVISFVKAFKAAQYFSAYKVNEIKPTAGIDSLHAVPVFDSTSMINVKAELPSYLAEAEDVSAQVDPMLW